MCLYFLHLFFFLLFFYLAFFHSPLHSSFNVERQRYDTSPAEDRRITDTTLEETCYLSISCFQDIVQYDHYSGSTSRGRLSHKTNLTHGAVHTPNLTVPCDM